MQEAKRIKTSRCDYVKVHIPKYEKMLVDVAIAKRQCDKEVSVMISNEEKIMVDNKMADNKEVWVYISNEERNVVDNFMWLNTAETSSNNNMVRVYISNQERNAVDNFMSLNAAEASRNENVELIEENAIPPIVETRVNLDRSGRMPSYVKPNNVSWYSRINGNDFWMWIPPEGMPLPEARVYGINNFVIGTDEDQIRRNNRLRTEKVLIEQNMRFVYRLRVQYESNFIEDFPTPAEVNVPQQPPTSPVILSVPVNEEVVTAVVRRPNNEVVEILPTRPFRDQRGSARTQGRLYVKPDDIPWYSVIDNQRTWIWIPAEGMVLSNIRIYGLNNFVIGIDEVKKNRKNRLDRERKILARHLQHVANLRNQFGRVPGAVAPEAHDEIVLPDNVVAREIEVAPFSVGLMSRNCEHCEAKQFEHWTYNCCERGQVQLAPVSFDQELYDNLTGNDEANLLFFDDIRKLNYSVQFVVQATTFKTPQSGYYSLQGEGLLLHRIPAIFPEEQVDFTTITGPPVFMLDAENLSRYQERRCQNFNIRPDVMRTAFEIVERNSPYPAIYRTANEIYQEQRQEEDVEPKVTVYFANDERIRTIRRLHAGCINPPKPGVPDVAAVYPTSIDGMANVPGLYVASSRMQARKDIVSHFSPTIDGMLYPLLFVGGDLGWSPHTQLQNLNRRRTKRVNLNLKQWTRYRLSRRDAANILDNGGKLRLQFAIDMQLRIESDKLNYLLRAQTTQNQNRMALRNELLESLAEARINGTAIVNAGVPVKLPASYPGGKRYMAERFHNFMAIVYKFGNPDLFITFTFNPKHDDVVNNLPQLRRNRPKDLYLHTDILNFIFVQHAEKLIDVVIAQGLFGPVEYHFEVVEFQKRGLPHLHMIVGLKDGCKPNTAERIDRFISAELPDRDFEPELFDIIAKQMVHGPCSEINCIKTDKDGKKKCFRGYPKAFQNSTSINPNGYPFLRRRDNGVEVTERNFNFNNSHVVPYSPELCKIFRSHINVEVVSTIAAIKYLCKYLTKGVDYLPVEVREKYNDNEILEHMINRCLTSNEAFYRIFDLFLSKQSHTVLMLDIHLPDHDYVRFNVQNPEEPQSNFSTLLAYFTLNSNDESARRYTYMTINNHYRYIKETGVWIKRTRARQARLAPMSEDSHVSTIRHTDERKTELQALRLLLLNVPGPRSYEHIRTVDDIVHPTFLDAANALRLFDADNAFDEAMREAVATTLPRNVRAVFALYACYNSPNNVNEIFERYLDDMIQDFVYNDFTPEIAKQMLLAEIRDYVTAGEKDLESLGLQNPTAIGLAYLRNYYNQTVPELTEEQIDEMLHNITECAEQQRAFDTIINKVRSLHRNDPVDNKLVYIDGPGGCGKTYLYTALYYAAKREGFKVLTCAWSGIAAILMPHGVTFHSLAGLPIKLDALSVSSVTPRSYRGKLLREVDLICIDEISMVDKYGFECLDRLLKDIRNSQQPFGGVVIAAGGDFGQIPPVPPPGASGYAAALERSVVTSNLWSSFEKISLVRNMRLNRNNEAYGDWLLRVRNGSANLSFEDNYLSIPENLILRGTNIIDLIDFVYEHNYTAETCINRCIVAPTNVDKHRINDYILNKLQDLEEKVFYSYDRITEEANQAIEQQYNPEYLHKLQPPGFPPHKLQVKLGAIYMIVRNLNPVKGILNGIRVKIVKMGDHTLECQILTGTFSGTKFMLPRITLNVDHPAFVAFKRKQFPIVPAYAMTINKAQGQTFDRMGIYLPRHVFSHGQFYVAASRCRDENNIRFLIEHEQDEDIIRKLNSRYCTRNIVHPELVNGF